MAASFLESRRFPIGRVDEESAREKAGGGRPEFWEMVFWWTRKPLIGARCFVAGATLGEDASPGDFLRLTRLDSERVPHRENPRVPESLRRKLAGMSLLDPFAGFGSIPLEAVRLGVGRVVAVELLPTAYVFLKAVLEVPKWAADGGLGRTLVADVERWGRWIVDRLREDPDIRELYEEGVAAYIGTWEVRCPHCGRYTPLVGNWWLARVAERSGRYGRLAWMEPVAAGGRVEIRVRDLNRELGAGTVQARVSGNTVETSGGVYRVPEPNVDARSNLARCLLCGRVMPGGRDRWYVKEALRDWNERVERYLAGEIGLEELKAEVKARPRLLAKVSTSSGNLTFEPATQDDDERLWKALGRLRRMWGDPDIPTEEIPEYENRAIWTQPYGLNKHYRLFNPRQLLTLVKLVKLVREVGRRVEEEKLGQGWDRERARRYAEAVTTYLAIAFVNHVRHNCLVTSVEPTQKFIAHALAFRGIAMTWNWVEEFPNANLIGSFTRSIESTIEGLRYLINAVSGSPSRVEVLLDDATALGRLKDEKFDLVVTDPPYRDDVPYAELSDFYYVWLKRALSDVSGGALSPRFHRGAFFDCLDDSCSSYVEIRTQWERFAPREVSVSEGRARFFREVLGAECGSEKDFVEKLGTAFRRFAGLLKDGGVVITYYAHTDPDAWKALLEAGRRAGLRVTAVYAVSTESAQRVTARGKVALDASVVVVWRRSDGGVGLLQEVEREALERASSAVSEALRAPGAVGEALDINLFLRSLGAVLGAFTSYSKLVPDVGTDELVDREIFPLALRGLVEGVYRFSGAERPLDPYASAYLVLKIVTGSKEGGRGRVDRTFASLLGVFGGASVDTLLAGRLLAKRDGELELLEPASEDLSEGSIRRALEQLLREKGLDPSRLTAFRTSVDVLHYLEYKALQLDSGQFRRLVEELESREPRVAQAVELARVLHAVLPKSDPERFACARLLHHVGMLKLGSGP